MATKDGATQTRKAAPPPAPADPELKLVKVLYAPGVKDIPQAAKDAVTIAAGLRGLEEITICGFGAMAGTVIVESPPSGGGGRWKAYY